MLFSSFNEFSYSKTCKGKVTTTNSHRECCEDVLKEGIQKKRITITHNKIMESSRNFYKDLGK